MTLGERIRTRREFLQYTRQTLCNITGVSLAQMARYETDFGKPTADVIVALAKGLGVTPDWLLGFEEGETSESLTELERHLLAIFRSRPHDSQLAILDLLKATTKI